MGNSVYDIVTDKILELLSQGQIPWKKPWKSTEGAKNLITKKPYRGLNQFLLNCSPYSSDYWLTFKQIQDKNGRLKKGSKSTIVIFWKWVNTVNTPTSDYNNTSDNPSHLKKIPLLRYYNVFNLDQVEGIQHPPEEQVTNEFTPIERAELIIENMPNRPLIQSGGDIASYSNSLDRVRMPIREAFTSPAGYYDTLFHELSHSTGHISRLGRKGVMEPSYFGSHEYSAEELLSQFSSSLVLGHLGLEQETIVNSAAYISNWMSVLKNDKKLVVFAAGAAQKAADYILNIKEDNDPEITD